MDAGNEFTGEFFHQMDEKGRVKLPTKLLVTLLDHYGRDCRLMRMPESCLAIYPGSIWKQSWQQMLGSLGPMMPGSSDARALTRILGANSLDIKISNQGRVSLPENFRKHINVSAGDNVAVIGAAYRIEIWKADEWRRHHESELANYEEIVERTMGLLRGSNGSEGHGE